MNAAAVKTCGFCEHSTQSTVENMMGFVWCKKRQEAGGTMEAVFLNPGWPTEVRRIFCCGRNGRIHCDITLTR